MIKINLMKGDCLELIKTLESDSIDSVITDPPYGMNFQSNMRKDKSKRFEKIANDERPFIWFLYDAFRVLKDGGALICFTDWKNQEVWRSAIHTAGFSIKSHIIWSKGGGGMGDLKSSFLPQHEICWFATKGKFSFHGKRPLSVIHSKKMPTSGMVHPTEKPVDLMGEIMGAITPPGGVVLDPFMGSGSTGVACKNLNRNFIGIERDEKYFEIAKNRIESA
jgi:DNA modification methylase